ncbi:phosphatidylserine/phosphatidylglycerophosphate/cardiolipin synthase family protein [Carboxylicivirga sp. M1479]|uniref:phospholipase D-like domain-containing protein n=1 Tax=Carboxylicivirga sp. M1479 TaxID=2594476 RepID=UPI0011789ABD|nr:phospholipase D family protein [Carboxylicivirga sp. M1479]TRX66330.1 phospholipase D family protein [Carboxylicivirga sp. M1479]
MKFLSIKINYLLLVLIIASCSPKKQQGFSDTDFCSKIHRNDSISLTSELLGLTDSMKTKTGVYVLEDGAGSMVARAWLSEYAEKTMDIQYFIFSLDNVGLIACDYIVRAADRGVKVRILVDDIMVDADIEDILTLDSHENISIKIYNPGVNLGKNIFSKIKAVASDFRSVNQRMHNKAFIVDGKVVITGGRNMADEYFDYDHEYNFRDRDVLLIGKSVNDVSTTFNKFWTNSLSTPVRQLSDKVIEYEKVKHRFKRLHEYACNPENFWPQIRTRIEQLPLAFQQLVDSGEFIWVEKVDFVSDEPGKNDGTQGLGGGGASTDALISLLRAAKYSIDIQTPYLVTTELSQHIFKQAVDRGVRIRILTNSLAATDNVEAFSAYQSSRKKLLQTGVEIYEFRPDAAERAQIMTDELHETLDHMPIFGLHAKSMVIDDEITVIGTFNLDPRSANLNTECIAIIHSEKIAKGVAEGMEIEFQPENSWQTTLDFNPDSKVSKIKRVKTWTRKVLPKDIL